LGQGLHVQLLGEPALLRGGRPRHADPRRPGLLAAQALRAHLPAPPPVPDHRGRRGDPDAPGSRVHVRVHAPARTERRGRRVTADLPDGNALASALRSLVGPVSIEGLPRLSGGASRQTWAFDAVAADGTRTELILRRATPGRPPETGAVDREAVAITSAHGAGLPVPELLFITDLAGIGPAGMVMRRVTGETIARKILRDEQYAGARPLLTGQLARFAAGLHALAVRADFPQPDPIAQLREQL